VIDLRVLHEKQSIVVGLRGTGKTTFSKEAMRTEKNSMAIDFYANKTKDGNVVGGEYGGFNRYAPTNKQYGEALVKEFNGLTATIIESGRVRMLVVDESNRIIPNKKVLPVQAMELIDKSRGFVRTGGKVTKGIGVLWCARRIAQLHTDVVETADFVIAFKQTGKNDLQRLDEIYNGLSDVMRKKISLREHNFIITNGSDYSVEKIQPSSA
jgi:KaiC/GvpD/RAD55 family RecA-like ATPase